MDTDKIELKAVMNIAQVAEYLTGLAKGLKAGTVVVEQDDQRLTLSGAETVEVEIEARMKKDKAKFSLEISWRLAPQEGETPDLKVGSGAEPKKEAPKAPAAPAAKPVIAAKPMAKPMAKPAPKPAPKPVAKVEAPKVIAKPEVKPATTPAPAHMAAPAPAKPKA